MVRCRAEAFALEAAVVIRRGESCAGGLSPLFLKDPATPEQFRRTKKAIVLRLLENRAMDRYDAIQTNATATWKFAVPLTERASDGRRETGELAFENQGTSALMLRPRKDINLLVPADAFWRNLLRAYVVLVAILTFVVTLGTFLSLLAALLLPRKRDY